MDSSASSGNLHIYCLVSNRAMVYEKDKYLENCLSPVKVASIDLV